MSAETGTGTTRVVTIRPLDVDGGLVEVLAQVDPELVKEAQRDGDGSVVALAVATMLLMTVKPSASEPVATTAADAIETLDSGNGACPQAHGARVVNAGRVVRVPKGAFERLAAEVARVRKRRACACPHRRKA